MSGILSDPGPEDTERARRGEAPLDIGPAEGGERIRSLVLASAPPQFVWQAVTDYDHLAAYVPGVRRSVLLSDQNGVKRVEQAGESSALGLGLTARVVLEVREQPPVRVEFRAVDGDFRRMEGAWLLTALDDGTACLITYGVLVKPRFWAPAFVLRRSLREDIPRQLRALARRAEQLAAKS